ncbi:CBS domain-containing protein, partial [Streptobacillus notomytis]|uniref:CBS domain-containing protein n=1 Tax=Streptobacillus notomytis TaxID=1712031 RepID=UPI000A6919B5
KDIVYVPETVTLTYMLEFFRQKQQHMAIIIDEYGGTLGLITIEDLLEEIVGEIRDEYDIEEENFKSIAKNSILKLKNLPTLKIIIFKYIVINTSFKG